MSSALADLLVTLAEPDSAEEFLAQPDVVMERAGLNTLDKMALSSRKAAWINHQARSEITDPEYYVKNGCPVSGELLDVIDVIDVIDVSQVA